MLSYVANHSKQRKTTKPIKCYELHRLDVKTIKTKINYKSDQNPMTCIDLTSKRSKMLSYVAKHSKQRKKNQNPSNAMNCIDWMSKQSKQS